jgi:pyruvate dehydrogenase complex dehydrogenase (E1) component
MFEGTKSALAAKDPAAANDSDPTETAEWLDALESVFRVAGAERAEFILSALDRKAKDLGVFPDVLPFGPYRNTIAVEKQGAFPGDIEMETRITAIIRWNALAMVVRANAAYGELGGHVASYASAAEIFEVGFNHFFRGADSKPGGDVVFFQPHSAPGVYARAFLEGRLTEAQLERYRQEIRGPGLASYPHPWLMPDFWQTPTGSMGIGPISAICQARFMRYLRDRGLLDTDGRRVWGVFGDGEMDEPESPIYIFYSMFGFQRVGDLIWAAADQRARGFLIGATAGRTTLAGEGLQHQDGSSHLIAATIPNCRAYDPAFAYEMAVILDHGVRSMMEDGKDEFFYLTAMNENYDQPSRPKNASAGIIKGLYLFAWFEE